MINYLQLVEDTEDGKENPFKAMAILKELQDDIKQCIDQIKPIATQEADKYDKSFELNGLKIERRNGKRNFSYKKLEDWKLADQAKKKLEKKYKAAWESYQTGSTPIDEDTGEVLPLPEVTYSSDVLIIKNLGDSLIH